VSPAATGSASGRLRDLLWSAMIIIGVSTAGVAIAGDAASEFEQLENRLLGADQVTIRFDIRSTGAVDSALSGQAAIGHSGQAKIRADGSFAGTAANLRLDASPDALTGGNGEQSFETARPDALAEGLLVGFTRMGLLHNLAMLSAGYPPDATNGAAREWVEASGITLGEPQALGGVTARAFRFTVVVGGKPSGLAELWIDADTGLPVRRVQIVSFPEGEMRVLEQYSAFELNGGD
jgi:hypothetical protein